MSGVLVTDQEIIESLKIWIHSDAWIGSLSRAILRIRAGTDREPSEEAIEEVQGKVLDAVRRRLV